MPLRQSDMIIAQDGPEHGQIDPLERRRNQRDVPLARHTIEDHARDIDIISVSGASECDGGGRLGLAGDIEHQHHRPPEKRCQIGGRTGPGSSSRGSAVEQSHHAFHNGNIRICRCRSRKSCDPILTHRPAIQIITWATGRDLVEGRIDIIRTALEGLNRMASTAKRAQQPERDGRFPCAGTWCRNDETRRTDSLPRSVRRNHEPLPRNRR